MGIFSTFFGQLLSRKSKRNSTQPKSNFLHKRAHSSGMNTESLNDSTATTSKQSSTKEGRDFKYNEDGRRYHGNNEVAYVLPNDDDGMYSL
jgi:hypothetical protein